MKNEKLDIAGKSIYCDETGGDYFDFFQFSALGLGKVGIAVGDAVLFKAWSPATTILI